MAPRSSGCSRSTKLSCVAEAKVKTSQVKSANMLPRMQTAFCGRQCIEPLAQQALEKVEQGGEMMIASNFPCFICSKSLSRSLLWERSIQGFLLISMQSISRLRPSVAQSLFNQLCISHRLGAPEKRYKTLRGLLAAIGVDGSRASSCVSGVPSQAFAPCVSAALLPAAVH